MILSFIGTLQIRRTPRQWAGARLAERRPREPAGVRSVRREIIPPLGSIPGHAGLGPQLDGD